MDLKGKIALVMGGGMGIGHGCAIALAHAGARIIICDIDGSALRKTAREIRTIRSDCAITTLHKNMFEWDGLGPDIKSVSNPDQIDILVTGPVSTVRKPVLKLAPEEYTQIFNDNCVSHIYLAKLVAQNMIRRKSGGSIVFISSVYGSLVREGSAPYDIAKAGLNQATRVLAKEWAKYGILVNAIAPGFTDTPGERKFATDAEIAEVVNKLPLRRAGTPQDIGEVAVMLASSKHITGQIITVDGGHSLVDLYDK